MSTNEDKDLEAIKLCITGMLGQTEVARGACAYVERLAKDAAWAQELKAKVSEKNKELISLRSENSKLRKKLHSLGGAHYRIQRRLEDLSLGRLVDADGLPIHLGDTLYGGDGQAWTITRPSGKAIYELRGTPASDGTARPKPLKAEWLTRTPREEQSES